MELRAEALMSGIQVENRTYSTKIPEFFVTRISARYRKMYFLYHAHPDQPCNFFWERKMRVLNLLMGIEHSGRMIVYAGNIVLLYQGK